jgi:hypothetical protein
MTLQVTLVPLGMVAPTKPVHATPGLGLCANPTVNEGVRWSSARCPCVGWRTRC